MRRQCDGTNSGMEKGRIRMGRIMGPVRVRPCDLLMKMSKKVAKSVEHVRFACPESFVQHSVEKILSSCSQNLSESEKVLSFNVRSM